MELTMESCLRGLHSRGFSPKHVIDIGASHGPWTSAASGLWPNARYTLFEPLAEHAAALDSLSNANPNITWFPCALGSSKSRMPISIYPDHLDAASLTYGGPASRDIAVERLDDYLADGRIQPAQLMKIDVQGFESEVLAGANNALTGVEVAIFETYFFRFAPRMTLFHELVAFMARSNFRVYEVLDPLRRPYDQAIGQCDICFVREGHDLVASSAWR
jgi:FkbM family methyltransferase